MKKTLLFLFIFMIGCANGPTRYKTLGHHKYGTYEFTKRSHPVIKPVAAIGGVVTDVTLICSDTVANIIVGIPLTFTHGGPDANGVPMNSPAVIFSPFWYPITVMALGVWPKDMYQNIFGEESQLFYDELSNKTNSSDAKSSSAD